MKTLATKRDPGGKALRIRIQRCPCPEMTGDPKIRDQALRIGSKRAVIKASSRTISVMVVRKTPIKNCLNRDLEMFNMISQEWRACKVNWSSTMMTRMKMFTINKKPSLRKLWLEALRTAV